MYTKTMILVILLFTGCSTKEERRDYYKSSQIERLSNLRKYLAEMGITHTGYSCRGDECDVMLDKGVMHLQCSADPGYGCSLKRSSCAGSAKSGMDDGAAEAVVGALIIDGMP